MPKRTRAVYCSEMERLEARLQLSSTAPDLTQSAAQLSVARLALVAASAGTDAIFAGGDRGIGSGPPLDAVDIYESSTRQWSTSALSEPKDNLAAAALGSKAFFAGGYSDTGASNVVDIFDASNQSWSTAHLSVPRGDLSPTSVAGKVLFAGGLAVSGVSDAVDIYDGATGDWSTAKLSVARADMLAFTIGHLAIFAGGLTTTDEQTPPTGSYIDIYNADTGAWTASFLNGYAVFGDAVVGSKAFLTAAPENAAVSTPSEMLTYDAVTNRWSMSAIPIGEGNPATSLGDKVLFSDGSAVDTYNAATGQWYSNAVSNGHALGAAITVGNQAIFAGGEAPELSSSPTVDIFTDTAPAAEIDGGVVGRSKGRATVTLSNTGDGTLAGNYTVQVYAIPPRQYHGAILLGSQAVNGDLAAGDSLRFSIPINTASAPAGVYHLVAMVKAADGTLTPFAGATENFTIGKSSAARPSVTQPMLSAPTITTALANPWLVDAANVLG